MATVAGNGVILTKGLEMLTFCQLNNRKFEFRNFYVSDDSSNITYNDIISPTGTFNNKLVQELVASASYSEVYGPEAVQDDGSFLSGSTTTEIPITLPIPVNALASNENFRQIYVTARDSSVDVNLIVDDLTNFAVGDTVTGGSSGATGVVVYTYNDAGTKRIYLKSVSTVNQFTPTEAVTSAPGGGNASCTAIETPTKVKVATHSFEVNDIVVGVTSGATGKVYRITAVSGGYDIYLINVDGVFTLGENIWVSNDSSTTRAITQVTQYAPEFVMYNQCLSYDDAVDPDTAASILSVPYIANGTDFNLRVTLEQVTGVVPSSYTFSDTRAVEIYNHNNSNVSHNTTHLRLDGGNSPSTNINWGAVKITNIADGTSATDVASVGQIKTVGSSSTYVSSLSEANTTISALPKIIDHTTAIYIDTDAADLNGASLTLSGFSGSGLLRIESTASTSSNKLSRINITDCSCQILIDEMSLYGGSIGIYADNSPHVFIQECTFENFSTACIQSFENSYVECNDVIIKGQTNATAAKAFDFGKIDCGNMLHDASTDYCTSNSYIAYRGGEIILPNDFSDISKIINNSTHYARTSDGGKVYGYFGDAGRYYEDTTSTDPHTLFLFFDVDTSTASHLNKALRQIGRYIPTGAYVRIRFDDGSTGDYADFSLSVSGFYGGGKILFSTVEASPSLTLTKATSSDAKDCLLVCYNNDIEIEFEKLTMTTSSSTPDYTAYLLDNKGKIKIDTCVINGTSDVDPIFLSNCRESYINDTTMGFASGLVGTCLLASGQTYVELDTCVMNYGGFGISAQNGACVHEVGSTDDVATDETKVEVKAIKGASVTISSSYTIDFILTISTSDGGTVAYADYIYINNKRLTAT